MGLTRRTLGISLALVFLLGTMILRCAGRINDSGGSNMSLQDIIQAQNDAHNAAAARGTADENILVSAFYPAPDRNICA